MSTYLRFNDLLHQYRLDNTSTQRILDRMESIRSWYSDLYQSPLMQPMRKSHVIEFGSSNSFGPNAELDTKMLLFIVRIARFDFENRSKGTFAQ